MKNLRAKIAIKLINLGCKLLPEEFKSETFILNCMKTKIIRVK